MFDIKFIFALAAATLLIIGYFPYFRDVFLKKTKPHLYTWLVWAITQSTAMVALWYGGGKFGIISLAIGTILVVAIFLLSFKYGTKNITKIDTIVLLFALAAIIVWWKLKNPLLAVFMVSAIDGLGYIPTFRKSFKYPWSETLSFWLIMTMVDILAILSSARYNFLTVTYLATLGTLNIVVFVICFFRRKFVVLRNV